MKQGLLYGWGGVALMAVLTGSAVPAVAHPPAADAWAAARPAPAAGQLLVARRDLPSIFFRQSVILLIRHEARGTVGVLLNRRTRFQLQELLLDSANIGESAIPVFIGGPVAPRTLVTLMRTRQAIADTERVTEDIAFSADRSVLESQLATGSTEQNLRVYAGYCAWQPGQLAAEMERDSWHVLDADTDLVFRDDEETLWQRLIDKLDPPGIRVQR